MRSALSPLALCALLTLAACDSGSGGTGGGGTGGDLRATLSTSDLYIAVISTAGASFTNAVQVVATVEGASTVTDVSLAAPGVAASLDSVRADGPNRARAYIRISGIQGRIITGGPTTLRIASDGDAAEVPLTVYTEQTGAPNLTSNVSAQLVHGREGVLSVQAVRLRIADAPAGLTLREATTGSVFQTLATATAAVPPNVAHQVLLHTVTAQGWAYGTTRAVVAVRATASNPAARVRTRSVGGGLRAGTFTNSLTALAQSGALVTRSEPGGSALPHLTDIRSLSPTLFERMYLLYRDGRVATVSNDQESLGVSFVGDLDPADIAPDGSLLLRDGSVWVTESSVAWRPLWDAAGRPQLTVLPASTETSFVAITADLNQTRTPAGLLLAASADGHLWAPSRTTGRLTPTARRLPSSPLEMVTSGSGVYGARLADGSVWTWRAGVDGDPASLTAPARIDGLVATRLFMDEYSLVATRADGSVASWGRPFPASSPCILNTLCERTEWAGLRESTFAGIVRADGKVFNTAFNRIEFGAAQPTLVVPE